MHNNTEKKKSYENMDNERVNFDNQNNTPDSNIEINQPRKSKAHFLHDKLDFLNRHIVFQYKPEHTPEFDARKFLIRGLLFLFIEYLIYFVFQLISYFPLKEFWRDSNYVPGIILGIVYAILVVLLVTLEQMKHKMLLYLLKILEMITAFFLLGYLVAWDFGAMSLTYIMIIDLLVIFVFVSSKDVL